MCERLSVVHWWMSLDGVGRGWRPGLQARRLHHWAAVSPSVSTSLLWLLLHDAAPSPRWWRRRP